MRSTDSVDSVGWAKARELGLALWANSRSRCAHQAALQQANLPTLRLPLPRHCADACAVFGLVMARAASLRSAGITSLANSATERKVSGNDRSPKAN